MLTLNRGFETYRVYDTGYQTIWLAKTLSSLSWDNLQDLFLLSPDA